MKCNGFDILYSFYNDEYFLVVGIFFFLFIMCFLFVLELLCLWLSDNFLESFDFLNMFFKIIMMVSKVSKK